MSSQFSKSAQLLRLTLIAAAITAVLAFNTWFLYSNFRNVSEQEAQVHHTATVLSELDLLLSAAKDAETGVRGYLLTNLTDYLEPYRIGVGSSWSHVDQLSALIQDPGQTASLNTLRSILQKRFLILEQLVTDFQRNHGKVDRSDLALSEGKSVMDGLRTQVDKMKAIENSVLTKRSESSERSKSLFAISLFITTGLILLVIVSAFYLIARGQMRAADEAIEKAREAQEKDLIASAARLSAGDISVETLGSHVLEFFASNFGILAGRLFLFDQGALTSAGAYGVKEGDEINTSSLVKAAASRELIWEVSEVPADYWHVSSSLGERTPTHLTFVPLSFQNRVLGVFELASFAKISSTHLSTLEKLRDTLGVGLNAAQTRAHLQTLFERTQQQSEELQAQQEELKTNNEELEQQARALESQQQALNVKNKELEFSREQLQAKAEDLERSSQYKSEFLAKMSHELRTPLNGLLILSTLLMENKEKNLTEQQREFARSINNAGNDLLVLINDILDLSKIEARKLSLRIDDFTLDSLFQSKRRSFGPQASAKGIEFVTDLPQPLAPLMLHTDRQRLEQILRNLLSNAFKFTEAGSVTLRVALDAEKDEVTFTVIDTGIGIPLSKQSAVFEAFEQADSSVSRKYGGTGLGLTISRELATLLGGTISLRSEEGRGSEFALKIPAHLRTADSTVAASAAPLVALPPGVSVDGLIARNTTRLDPLSGDRARQNAEKALRDLPSNKKSILIVEDDENFRSSIVETVKTYDFAPIEAPDGEAALAVLNQYAPDAILLDIKLPGISGLGILEMIKQMPHLRHIPVHMISALEYQQNALRMGALGYLTKPVTIEKVRSALGRIENMIAKKLRRVLLIEDDERQNLAISELIAGQDIEVVSVKTGKSAVEKLKQSGFDCIVLDLTLPDVSGFDLLSELRSLDISLPPVVIYTGRDLSDEEERYLRKYSESIIIKGARSPERLLDEVNLFLHRVESLLPEEKREMLSQLRSQEKSFEGKTVLLVDDDIRNVFALTSALETRSLHVRVARNGLEALEAIDKYRDIDIVLMDIMMPKMDGFEAMRRIRQSHDAHARGLPIIALTAKAMKEDHEKCMEAGASDYLPKPVNLDNLLTVLKVWLAPKGFLS